MNTDFTSSEKALKADRSAATLPAAAAKRCPLRILVADDNPTNLKLFRIVLAGFGYRPDEVSNGQQVLEALRQRPYDLVLMDIRMPEMDGIEATRRIRAQWRGGHGPRIVAVTAGMLAAEREACLAAGADEFLLKPTGRAQLGEVLARCEPLDEHFAVTLPAAAGT